VNEGERRQRLIRFASAATFLALAAVAVLVAISLSQTSGGDTSLEDVRLVERQLAGIPQRDMTLGDPSAPVALIEFGDLQCPACKGYAEDVLPQVIESKVRAGKARIEFRNYPIIGAESTPAAAAALAAAAQGRGWSFVELFYRNQGIEETGYVTDSFLTAIARGAGVPDVTRWNADRRSPGLLERVSREARQAQELGFSATPSFAVRGPTRGLEALEGTASRDEIEAAIRHASPK
jgi:protein-disulfide isomerase